MKAKRKVEINEMETLETRIGCLRCYFWRKEKKDKEKESNGGVVQDELDDDMIVREKEIKLFCYYFTRRLSG